MVIQMKKLCVIANVFGKYQAYIPLFALSWLRAYSYVDIRIYLNDTVDPLVKKQLELLDVAKNVTIIENVIPMTGLTENAARHKKIAIAKCIRWIIYEPIFEEYEALYIGDIDIVIANEDESLFDQHMRHATRFDMPYSNIVRSIGLPNQASPREIVKNIYLSGLLNAYRILKRSVADKPGVMYKLSGLHFILTKEYLPAIAAVKETFIGHLNNMGDGKDGYYDIGTFNNEAFLHDMVKASGLPVPEDSTKKYDLARQQQDPEYIFFRPHHGMHLGIFRETSLMENSRNRLDSDAYKLYYEDFRKLSETEDYKKIEPFFRAFVANQLRIMHSYYSRDP